MPEQNGASDEKMLEPKVLRSKDYRSVYANNASFSVTAFEISTTFGEIIGTEKTSEGDRLVVEQHVRVSMSHLHAKIFLEVLARNLADYEKRFGEIKRPDSQETASK